MAGRFNADELFEIAEQIERNGAHFYRRSAQVAVNPEVREILMQLADMEERHERIFAGMRDDLWRENPKWLSKFYNDEGEEEAAAYLDAIAKGHVFDLKTDPNDTIPPDASLERVLQTAIAAEKDSIVFYLGIKDAVPKDLGRDKVDAIIREEMSHITILCRYRAEVA